MSSIVLSPAVCESPLRHALRVTGLPVLLLANIAVITWAITAGVSLPVSALLLMLGTLALLCAFERAIPFRTEWHPTIGEWVRDAVYFAVNGAVSTVVRWGVVALGILLARDALGWQLAYEIPVAFAVSTLVGYWTHRLGHDIGAMWQMHGVHHRPQKVNTANNNVIHSLDLGWQTSMDLLALLLVGFSAEAVFAASALSSMFSFAAHANADFRLGWLNYVIGGPEQHRLHHSQDVAEAGHFSSALPLWDLLFGSFTWRPGRQAAAFGIAGPNGFPRATAMLRSFVHPFRVWLGRKA